MISKKLIKPFIFICLTFTCISLYAAISCGDALLEAYDSATELHTSNSIYCSTEMYPVECNRENDLQYEQALDNAYDDWVNCI